MGIFFVTQTHTCGEQDAHRRFFFVQTIGLRRNGSFSSDLDNVKRGFPKGDPLFTFLRLVLYPLIFNIMNAIIIDIIKNLMAELKAALARPQDVGGLTPAKSENDGSAPFDRRQACLPLLINGIIY